MLYIARIDQIDMMLLNLLKKAGINGFFFSLIGMVVLAWLFPFYGTSESPLHLSEITHYGVSVIFFFYGLRLSPGKLRAGLRNWKLHVVIQSTTFILFPVLILLLFLIIQPGEDNHLWTGVFFLAALPSTVSSSVVLVSIARGNIPAAIFNASISSIIGIFITPLWMSLFLGNTAESVDLGNVVFKLFLQVLAPVIIGLTLHGKLKDVAERFGREMRYFDQLIILLIVYSAFSESFYEGMFQSSSLASIAFLAGGMLLFFFVMLLLMTGLSALFRFSREDKVTVLFCGSKKSLVQGAVMGKVLFPDPVLLGLVLLPVMLYHGLQLLAGSALAERMGRGSSR